MLKYALKRLVLIFFTLFIILTITYVLMMKLPRYITDITVLQDRDKLYNYMATEVVNGYYEENQYPLTQEEIQAGKDKGAYAIEKNEDFTRIVITEYNEGKRVVFTRTPVFKQYGKWLSKIVKGDWGMSETYRRGTSTWTIMGTRFAVNIKINIWASLISVPVGILIGCLIALRKNSLIDQIVMVGSLIFSSVPSFVIITFMMLGAKYVGLPTQWQASDSLTWKAFIIPVTALAIGPIGGYTRVVRNELAEVMTSDFVLLARTKGLTTAQTISRHAFRNAMVIYIPAIFGEIIGLLSGSLVLEKIYGIPGVGPLFLQAINLKDYNLIMTILAFEVFIGLGFGLFADLMYGVIDPRIRIGSR